MITPWASAGLAFGGALWVAATLVSEGAGEGSDRFHASETLWLLAAARTRAHEPAGLGAVS